MRRFLPALALAAALAPPAPAASLGPALRAVVLSTAYQHDPDADAIMAAAGAPLPSQGKLVTAMVTCLKSGNGSGNAVWKTKLGGLFVFAAWSSQAMAVDWVRPSHLASFVNSPACTVNVGCKGDAATSYIDHNDTFGSAASLASQNSGTIGSFGQPIASSIGSMTTNSLYVGLNTTTAQGRLNANATQSVTVSVAATNHATLTRNSASTQRLYVNGASVGDLASTSMATAIGTEIATFRRNGSTYTGSTVSIDYYGAGMSDADVAVIDACARPYMRGLGLVP